MSHNEEHTRCQLIGACASSAQSSMDAAAVEITRAQDADAMEMVSEIRQRLGELQRRYPCDRGQGRPE